MRATQAAQIALGHLKASYRGNDAPSVRASVKFFHIAEESCSAIVADLLTPLNPDEMIKANEHKKTIQDGAGSPAGNPESTEQGKV